MINKPPTSQRGIVVVVDVLVPLSHPMAFWPEATNQDERNSRKYLECKTLSYSFDLDLALGQIFRLIAATIPNGVLEGVALAQGFEQELPASVSVLFSREKPMVLSLESEDLMELWSCGLSVQFDDVLLESS